MPIAEKFKALGAGNGFPGCVETDPNMTTGYALEEVVNLFWNTATVNVANVSSSYEGFHPDGAFSVQINKLDLKEPKDRVKNDIFMQNDGDAFSYPGTEAEDHFDYADAAATISTIFNPVKGEDSGNFSGKFNLSKQSYGNPTFELRAYGNASFYIDERVMQYHPFELNQPHDHTVVVGGITFYGYYQDNAFQLPFDQTRDPHITSIDLYTYPQT
tara:strand:- start:707 stop:1351 length:645 start_codon:yes stop_codon:yes gene_type:complete